MPLRIIFGKEIPVYLVRYGFLLLWNLLGALERQLAIGNLIYNDLENRLTLKEIIDSIFPLTTKFGKEILVYSLSEQFKNKEFLHFADNYKLQPAVVR